MKLVWRRTPTADGVIKKGHKARKQDIQGAHRRLQPAAFLTTKGERSPRKGFIYFSDDGDLVALRFDNWKVVFMEQRASGTLRVWSEPFVALRLPKLFNLRTDPFERTEITSNTYYQWTLGNGYLVLAASLIVAEFLKTFKDFPPRQKAASFTIDQAMEKMESVASGALH
jgi:arylsulfatase A-like enzyme